jgi:hypothetical protein
MDEKTLKWAIGMLWLAIAVNILLILIDMKLKNDIVGGLKNAEATQVGSSNWTYTLPRDPRIPANGSVRFAPRMEEGAGNDASEEGISEASAESWTESSDGAGNPGIPESSE